MKKQFCPIFALTALALVGCTVGPSSSSAASSSSVSSETSSTSHSSALDPSSSFEDFAAAIQNGHNYTIDIVTTVEDEEEPEESEFFNIDDKAIFATYSSGYSGFIAQENQGYINFVLAGSNLYPGDFYYTNPSKGLSELYDVNAENLFLGGFTEDAANPGVYVNTNTDAIAVACNLTGYVEAAGFVAGSSIQGHVNEGESSLQIEVSFTLYYIDEETGDQMSPKGLTTLTIKNIGSTHNAAVESYLENPTAHFAAPTAWGSEEKSYFDQYFNGYYPSFIPNASYTFSMDGPDPDYPLDLYAYVTDYGCGNQVSAYGDLLVSRDGFTKISDTKFTKLVVDEEANKKATYTVSMVYVDPSRASGSHTIGWYHPAGIFQVQYSCTVVNNAVTDNASFNSYIHGNHLEAYVPDMNFDCEVSNFIDNTATMASLYGDEYLFTTKGKNNNYFTVNFGSNDLAKAAAQSYVNALKAKGFTTEESFLSCLNLSNPNDSKQSYVSITDPDNVTDGYFQLRFCLYKSLEEVEPATKTLSSIALSGMTTEFYVSDDCFFDGVCTAFYSDGTSAEVTPTSVSAPILDEAGTETVTVTYVEDGVSVSATYDITVTEKPAASKIPLAFQGADHITSYEFLDGSNQAITEYDPDADAGYFYMNIVCESGYVVESLSILGDSAATAIYNSTWERWEILPGDSETASITVVPNVVAAGSMLSVDPNMEHATVRLVSPSSAGAVLPETQVRFSVTVENGYELVSVSIKEDPNIEISKNPMGQNSYFFTMPDGPATIVVTTKAVESASEEEETSTPSVSTDALVSHGEFLLDYSDMEDYGCIKLTFRADGTGEATTIRYNAALGDRSITQSFSWEKTLSSGSTYAISILNIEKQGAVGAAPSYHLSYMVSLNASYSTDGSSVEAIEYTASCNDVTYSFSFSA